MFKVTAETTVKQPPDKVFPYVTNFANDAEWWPGVEEAKRVSEGEHGPGARYQQRVKLMGMHFEHTIDITEFEPGKRMAFKCEDGLTPFSGTYTFESVPEGTKILADTVVNPGGLFKLLRPLFIPLLRRQTEQNFASLKRVLDKKDW